VLIASHDIHYRRHFLYNEDYNNLNYRDLRASLRGRWHDYRHRLRVVSASVALYRALGRRGRNGIWVYWRSLDPDEQTV
jgi:hypothetical protein